jgi:hypothetical protein
MFSDAALILVEVWGRGTRINARIIDTTISRLKESMENRPGEEVVWDDMRNEAEAVLDLARGRFWAAFVGGVAAGGREERWWFLEHLKEERSVLGVEDWEAAREILYGFLWCDLWEERSKEIWTETQSLS